MAKLGSYLIVSWIATWDGERQHPMDACSAVVQLDADGRPTGLAMADLTERIRRNIGQKVTRGDWAADAPTAAAEGREEAG